MRAKVELSVVHAKGPGGLAALGDRNRLDQIEVVEIATGESALFWDVHAGDVKAMLRALRADLAEMDTDEFLQRWGEIRGPADLAR